MAGRTNTTMENKMFPIELVKELDKYIVGQKVYKETVAKENRKIFIKVKIVERF